MVTENGRSKNIVFIQHVEYDYYVAILALTTAAPTVVYLFLLLFSMFSKIILSGTRWIILHFLEVATEPDPLEKPKEFLP